MIRCCQATSHYLSQCWPSYLMSYGVTCHSFNWLYSLHRQAISGYAIDFVSSTIRVFLKKHFPDLCCCSLEESYEIWARKSSFVCLYTTEGWNPMNLRVNCLQPKYPLTGSATMTLTQYEHQASQISRTRLFVQQKNTECNTEASCYWPFVPGTFPCHDVMPTRIGSYEIYPNHFTGLNHLCPSHFHPFNAYYRESLIW